MKEIFIVANWKSHMTLSEAERWMSDFLSVDLKEQKDKVVIICPPFTLLSPLSEMLQKSPSASSSIKLGAQNISPFMEGAHTGEETGEMIADFASYVIIGHSERRKEFGETDAILAEKVQEARASHLEPIFCIQGKDTPVPEGVAIVAYEPLSAIGSGHPDTPEDADSLAKYMKESKGIPHVLYGGSVTPDNVAPFTAQEYLNGVLVGGASLDGQSFAAIVQKA